MRFLLKALIVSMIFYLEVYNEMNAGLHTIFTKKSCLLSQLNAKVLKLLCVTKKAYMYHVQSNIIDPARAFLVRWPDQ